MAWVTVPQGDSEAICSGLEKALNERMASGAFSAQDVENIRNRQLSLIPKDLEVSPVILEKLRRLCQLWEVDIRTSQISSHRKFIGPVIVGFKKLLFPVIRFILKDFIREQRDFNAEVISLVAELANSAKSKKEV